MAEIKVVSFRVGDEVYAVDIMKIDSIAEMMKTMKLPGLPSFMMGVANLRGEVIPIIDTRVKFMLDSKSTHDGDRVVVVYVGDKKIGIVVDEVKEVLTLGQDQLEEPPRTGGSASSFISAIAKMDDRMLMIIDIDKVLTSEELIKIDKFVDNF
ncbi:MAG TPA: chemotaxis protein CheW [Thermotogota bacterium]|nr:chemotaxis protein CheW [Thermotogota bacterium]HPJ89971.1 chemotaxis protein CheW [Thermotogota bacterium]HPR97042.1 chemotaxis protein CheW [Thermotogota bacterium]